MKLMKIVPTIFSLVAVALVGFSTTAATFAQETSQEAAQEVSQEAVQEVAKDVTADQSLPEKLQEHAQEIGQTLNESQTVQDVSSSILQPIYQLAEFLSFPTFYWVAFCLMVAGVVSYLLQLVIGKFFLLFRLNLNVKEILSDFLGLLISLIGLVLTTQAATQNSTFPQNASAVISSAAVGLVLGLVFFWWGQSLEHRAASAPKVETKTE